MISQTVDSNAARSGLSVILSYFRPLGPLLARPVWPRVAPWSRRLQGRMPSGAVPQGDAGCKRRFGWVGYVGPAGSIWWSHPPRAPGRLHAGPAAASIGT